MSQGKNCKKNMAYIHINRESPNMGQKFTESSQGAASFYLRMNWNGKLM